MMKMRKRLGDIRRVDTRRRPLQLLGTLGIAICGAAIATDTKLACYASHPAEHSGQFRMISVKEVPGEIARTNALLLQPPTVLPVPEGGHAVADDSLFDPADLGQDSRPHKVDAIVDQADRSPLAGGEAMMPPVRAPLNSQFAFGAVAGSYSAAPSMIGDFFGGTFLVGAIDDNSESPSVSPAGVNTISLAGGDRRFKVAENVSPIPQDRAFFNYNHFHNALLDVNEASKNLDRFTFGFEKTFHDGTASIETRLPFASALNSRQKFGVADTQHTELGNLALGLKVILLSGEHWLLSGGTTLTLPTGDDYELFIGDTRHLLIENDAVHMAPFLGYLAQLNRHWFAQAFLQTDFDLNGNDVSTNANGFEGVLQDQNLLFVDVSVGRWLHRRHGWFSGVAAITELHYTTTINNTDIVAGVTNPDNRMDVLNATGALNFQVGSSSLRVGGAAPLRDHEESLYDAEIIVQFNRYF